MRFQLALNVDDLKSAVAFYSRAFAVEPNKQEPGYANFIVNDPPLKLVLIEAPDADERLNHVGVEVFDDADVHAAGERLDAGGLNRETQLGETCCYAKQNKVVTHDPQGTMWEWYRVIEDTPPTATRGVCC